LDELRGLVYGGELVGPEIIAEKLNNLNVEVNRRYVPGTWVLEGT
jgi:hypothetical protein